MIPSRVIGFAGRKGAGKSTAAAALAAHAPLQVSLINFADPLKQMLRVALSAEQVDGDLKETPIDWLDGITPRRLMQTLGTEWGRDLIHPEFWVRLWGRQADAQLSWPGAVVVTADVRFPNELAAIRSMGGKVVWVERHAEQSDGHVSENLLRPRDCEGWLANTGTVESLARQVVHLARLWGALP